MSPDRLGRGSDHISDICYWSARVVLERSDYLEIEGRELLVALLPLSYSINRIVRRQPVIEAVNAHSRLWHLRCSFHELDITAEFGYVPQEPDDIEEIPSGDNDTTREFAFPQSVEGLLDRCCHGLTEDRHRDCIKVRNGNARNHAFDYPDLRQDLHSMVNSLPGDPKSFRKVPELYPRLRTYQ